MSAKEALIYAKSKLFLLNAFGGRPTDAVVLEMENLSHRKAQKHSKKSLKELTTETEHVLLVLSFLPPLHRRFLDFNGN